ncbi:zinc-binding alcohol dehydrogenase family protein [Salegentibacter sp. JZCK2]|uniref:zinc-binding alcohol dehydrogenase family protein n=1 Tax=Salegentibacter tibetensis TaxID=2873600 RepID=UPI001CC9B9AC|nr:zinc-binding alcohol dehydrogenase family protein [Salegentibacter tibetensis]MBZ9729026.1 zinc-binding alcohol dehydrogenase family protein [Salegentibacter tibetensis]
MKAVGIKKSLPITDKDSFVEFNTEEPTPGDSDLLVRIKAVSVNPVDFKVRQNAAKDKELEKPKILGWDAAGIVEQVGNKVTKFKQGDEVFYAGEIDRPGCNAEFQLVTENIAGHKPKNISFEEAAALPLTSLTAWECIFERLKIKENSGENQDILIIGGAGGVGSIGIQLLKKLTKFNVIATASRNETEEWCRNMGADVIVNHKNLEEEMRSKGYEQVDYILNFSDTDMHWNAMAELIKPQGDICSIVETKNPVDLNKLKNKSVAFHWELMFTRAKFQTPDMHKQHEILERISKLLEEETIESTLNKTFTGLSAQTFKEVHELQETGKSIGKNVISF